MQYRLNHPDVTCEVFDREVLAINLSNGHYYSLRETAVPIWVLLLEGGTVETISEVLAGRFPNDAETIPPTVRTFVGKLEEERLIVRLAPGEQPQTAGTPLPPLAATFAPPLFERYTDMQELLLLDPIHEVDVTGWPARPREPKD